MPQKTLTFMEFLKTFGITICTIIAGAIANDAHQLMKSMEELKIEQNKIRSELTWHEKFDEAEFRSLRISVESGTSKMNNQSLAANGPN